MIIHREPSPWGGRPTSSPTADVPRWHRRPRGDARHPQQLAPWYVLTRDDVPFPNAAPLIRERVRTGDIVGIDDREDGILRKSAREFALHIRKQELPSVAGVARSDDEARDERDRGQPPFSNRPGHEPLRVRLRPFVGPKRLPGRAVLPHDDAGRHPDPGHAAREEEPRYGRPQPLFNHLAGPLDVHDNVVSGPPNPGGHAGRETGHRGSPLHLT